MEIANILIYLLLSIGVFFNFVGIVGLFRFPDVFTRLHAETKTTTFGTIFISIGVAIYCFENYFPSEDGSWLSLGVRVIVATVILAFTNATGAHAIARAAYLRGQRPTQAVVDKLRNKQDPSKETQS